MASDSLLAEMWSLAITGRMPSSVMEYVDFMFTNPLLFRNDSAATMDMLRTSESPLNDEENGVRSPLNMANPALQPGERPQEKTRASKCPPGANIVPP